MDENITTKRLINELFDISNNTPKGITVVYDDMFQWTCYITYPEGSCCQGLTYELRTGFRKSYPYMPPVVRFITPMFHPNVDENGVLHLSVLDCDWTPALSVEKLLHTIRSILLDPETGASIVNNSAWEMFQSDKEQYQKHILETAYSK